MGIWVRVWRAAGTHSAFTAVARRLVSADRWLGRITHGRLVAAGTAPALLLTTTGRRTGQPRTVPLQYFRDGGDFVVIASNWGGRHDPAWALNLLATPGAVVTAGGRDVEVHATPTGGSDHDRLWSLFVDQWPGYETYRHRAPHRTFRIFRLTPRR
jgi:deazaflavin-dependent oxidoreductase (nitroreductase family)